MPKGKQQQQRRRTQDVSSPPEKTTQRAPNCDGSDVGVHEKSMCTHGPPPGSFCRDLIIIRRVVYQLALAATYVFLCTSPAGHDLCLIITAVVMLGICLTRWRNALKTTRRHLSHELWKEKEATREAQTQLDRFPQQKLWSLIIDVLQVESRKRLGIKRDSYYHDIRFVLPCRDYHTAQFLPCCASKTQSPLFASFKEGLSECNLELADIVCDNGEFNGMDFILAFHGTGGSSVRAIACGGFDPKTRKCNAYGPGEYFGEFSAAEAYSQRHESENAIFLSLLIKQKTKSSFSWFDKETYFIVNNPPAESKKTYCLPFGCIATGRHRPNASCRNSRCGPLPAGMNCVKKARREKPRTIQRLLS